MASDKVMQISDSEFESKVLKGDLPCLIDFWAPWCGPCKAIAPVIDELAEEYDGRLQIVKMNVDDNPATPGKYGIRAIPTLILALVVISVLGTEIYILILVIAILDSTRVFRLSRAIAMDVAVMEFVEAAHTILAQNGDLEP